MPPAVNAPAESPLMMRPPPRPVMDSSTAWVHRRGPRRLTFITRSHSPTGMLDSPYGGRSVMIAALLIRMSMPPKASTAAAAIAWVDSRGGDVDTDADHPVTLSGQFFGGVFGCGGVDIGDNHRSTCLAQGVGVDDADAAGTSGDDGHLSGEVEQPARLRHGDY